VRLRISTALFALAAGSIARAQTAHATVVKIPSASMPSTVAISTSGGSGLPGKNLNVPFTLTLGGVSAPTSFQFDLSYDPAKLTFVSATAGAQLTGAGLGLSTTVVSSSDVRLTTTGSNPTGVANGAVATVLFTMASTFSVTFTTLTTMNCLSANLGTPLSTGCSGGTVTVSTCTVTGDTSAGVVDVQTMINEALGVSAPLNDLNSDGVINLADVQIVAGAAMGRGCVL
jgi:hypothetical protein